MWDREELKRSRYRGPTRQEKREAHLGFLRQMANGSRKRLPKSERKAIMNASQQGK